MATKQDGKPHTLQKISFKYLKYALQDGITQVERRKGAIYKVSPYKLLINDGNYYLLGYGPAGNRNTPQIATYRIDRMKEVKLLNEPREGAEEFAKIDIESYTRRVFSMFGGEQKRVSIRFRNYLLDTAIERFGTGKDVFYRPDGKEHFVVTADVEISDQFFAWVCGFGKRAKIIAPNETISMIKDFVCNIKSLYDD